MTGILEKGVDVMLLMSCLWKKDWQMAGVGLEGKVDSGLSAVNQHRLNWG